jgi:NADH:ubiquinone oxidoreductase subunit E
LGLSDKKITTGDFGFTVETVSCLGACGLAPVMTVNDTVHPAMTPEKAEALLAELTAKRKAHENRRFHHQSDSNPSLIK